ncbi:hypothetical protein ACN6MY_06375 [Peribacillus sp. B-H-3]|uniref:hypothetical protein n=1 Tax=Peribacillus sp. B-H-3 TaxID=3400420 RepID=UPI003B01C015
MSKRRTWLTYQYIGGMMMEVKHKYEFTVNGMEITLKDKSHAGIFRQFWSYFMNLDVNKTIICFGTGS